MEQENQDASGLLEAIKREVVKKRGYDDWEHLLEDYGRYGEVGALNTAMDEVTQSYALAVGEAVKDEVEALILIYDNNESQLTAEVEYLSVQDIINSLNK